MDPCPNEYGDREAVSIKHEVVMNFSRYCAYCLLGNVPQCVFICYNVHSVMRYAELAVLSKRRVSEVHLTR
jgi:hypothetical protein